jgi:hypothetical protein
VLLRDDAPIRADGDYELLKEYRDRLDADVIALRKAGLPE